MRPPRLRFTLLGSMIGVAAVALALGGWVAFQSNRRGHRYRSLSRSYASQVAIEAQIERSARAMARQYAMEAKQVAEEAIRADEGREQLREREAREVDPGIFGGRPAGAGPSIDNEVISELSMSQALMTGKLARIKLDQANQAAKRAARSAQLAKHYEQAALHPMRPLPPDPPEPK